MIELFLATLDRAVKDLGSEDASVREGSINYFLAENDYMKESCKKFAVDHTSIQREVEEIVKEEDWRKKKLIKNLTKQIREYA